MGVDVGGTKILAGLAEPSGRIRARHRLSTPRDEGGDAVLAAITEAIEGTLKSAKVAADCLAMIGVGLPGVIDPNTGVLVVAPNMDLEGPVAARISEHFGVPVVLGNDGNVALLAEQRFGAAQKAAHAIGIFVGTGIGGGVICNRQLLDGSHGAAAELGHMIMVMDGPLCNCGNRGCLEALASRTAIERDLREAVQGGRKSMLTKLSGGEPTVIKSGLLRRCLEAQDPLVTEVIGRASKILGLACISLRHLLDPEIIVFGGGVVAACGSFMLPIIQETFSSDPFLGSHSECRVVEAKLGDDAGMLGAVALAQLASDDDPHVAPLASVGHYPTVAAPEPGEIVIDGDVYTTDIYVRADGKVKKRKRSTLEEVGCDRHQVCAEELDRLLKGDPELLVIGTGYGSKMTLTPEAQRLLAERQIQYVTASTDQAAVLFNEASGRKAALLHSSS
jgi:glucokinase